MRRTGGKILFCLVFVIPFLFASCQKGPTPVPSTETTVPTETTYPTATLPIQPTHTPQPLGSEGNPIFLASVLGSDNPDASAASLTFVQQLSTKTGLTIQSVISQDYKTLLLSLKLGKTHLAWLPPLTYIYAQQQGSAQVGLVTNQFGVYRYGVQFVANINARFTPYYDPTTKKSTADAAHALVQFAGKRPCLVDPTSPAGYIVPLGILASESIQSLPAVLTQEETSVIRALYAGGICDFGATFAISGDPRTAESLNDLTDLQQKIPIIWQSDPVIPYLNLSYSPQMDKPTWVKIRDAILQIAQNQDGLDLLSRATLNQIAGIKAVDDNYYTDLRTYVDAFGGDPASWIGR